MVFIVRPVNDSVFILAPIPLISLFVNGVNLYENDSTFDIFVRSQFMVTDVVVIFELVTTALIV